MIRWSSFAISNNIRQSLLQSQYHFPCWCWVLFRFVCIVSNSQTEVGKVASARSTWRWRILTSSASSRTVLYFVYAGKISVWNLQPRQPLRGSNRFCAKRHFLPPRAFWYDLMRSSNVFSISRHVVSAAISCITSSWVSNSNGTVDNFQGLLERTQLRDQTLVVVWGAHVVAESIVDWMNDFGNSNNLTDWRRDDRHCKFNWGHHQSWFGG